MGRRASLEFYENVWIQDEFNSEEVNTIFVSKKYYGTKLSRQEIEANSIVNLLTVGGIWPMSECYCQEALERHKDNLDAIKMLSEKGLYISRKSDHIVITEYFSGPEYKFWI